MLAFTLAPGGGGPGDRLVSEPIIPAVILERRGEKQAGSNFRFGPLEKAAILKGVRVVPTIYVREDTPVTVTLSFEGKVIPIGVFTAQGDPDLRTGSTAELTMSFDPNLLVPAGKIATIDIVAKESRFIGISSDTYVWFNVLQARSSPPAPWWEVLLSGQSLLAVILFVFSVTVAVGVYNVRAERWREEQLRRQKEQLAHLERVGKNLAEANKLLEEVRDLLKRPPSSTS
jgi:hypothetical protein